MFRRECQGAGGCQRGPVSGAVRIARRPLRFFHAAAAALMVLAAGVHAGAQQSPADVQPAPPVEALVALALERAPSLAAARERLEAARAALPAADALPDPMIEFEYRNSGFPRYTIGTDEMSMAGAMVRLPLLSGGRRRASRAAAEAEVGVRAASRESIARELAAEVRVQYARLFALDSEAETLSNAREVADMLAATAEARYVAGGAAQAGIIRAQLELSRIDERLADVAAERSVTAATLNRLLNEPPDVPVGRVVSLPDPGPPFAPPGEPVSEAAARLAPRVSVLDAEEQLAGRRVEMSRAELGVGWSVGTGVFWRGGFDRVVNFNVGIELPLWKNRKQQPLVEAAEREREAARRELEDARAEARAEAARLLAEWKNADDQLRRYHEAIVPQSSAAFDATRAGFLGGRDDFVSVLDEFRRWIEIRVDLARREAARFTARARLEALVPPPTAPGGTTSTLQSNSGFEEPVP